MAPTPYLVAVVVVATVCRGGAALGNEPLVLGRVACIGDSITYGAYLTSRDTRSYPARLQQLLGPRWVVGNFGAPDQAVGPWTTRAVTRHPSWRAAQEFQPDVVVLLLGTNDGQTRHWRSDDAFLQAAGDLVRAIHRWRRSRPEAGPPHVLIALPPPVFEARYEIQPQLVRNHVVLRWCELAAHHQWDVVDTHTPWVNRRERFPDGVHLDEAGALALACMIYDALVRPGGPCAGPEDEPVEGLRPRVPTERALDGADWLTEHQQWCEQLRTSSPSELVVCTSREVAAALREATSNAPGLGVLLAEGERAPHVLWRLRHGAWVPQMSRITLCPDVSGGEGALLPAEAEAWWAIGQHLRRRPGVRCVGWAPRGRPPRTIENSTSFGSAPDATGEPAIADLRAWARQVAEWLRVRLHDPTSP